MLFLKVVSAPLCPPPRVPATQAMFRFGVTTPAVMSSVIVPVLLRGLSDALPNVRLTAARVADDVLTLAVMSSWPPPRGRGGGVLRAGRSRVWDDADDENASVSPRVMEGSGGGGGGGGAEGGACGGDASARSRRAGWGCGWDVVDARLETLSRFDRDRDVAYFATQALKPKWAGDRCR